MSPPMSPPISLAAATRERINPTPIEAHTMPCFPRPWPLALVPGLLLVALAAGCASKAPPPPPPAPAAAAPARLSIDVDAAGNANRGLPVVVRVYELTGTGAFGGADFFSLYDRDGATLGGEMLSRESLTLAPGQGQMIDKPLNPEARYLGVVAAFRDIDRARWRGSMPLIAGRDNAVTVTVGADSVTVSPR